MSTSQTITGPSPSRAQRPLLNAATQQLDGPDVSMPMAVAGTCDDVGLRGQHPRLASQIANIERTGELARLRAANMALIARNGEMQREVEQLQADNQALQLRCLRAEAERYSDARDTVIEDDKLSSHQDSEATGSAHPATRWQLPATESTSRLGTDDIRRLNKWRQGSHGSKPLSKGVRRKLNRRRRQAEERYDAIQYDAIQDKGSDSNHTCSCPRKPITTEEISRDQSKCAIVAAQSILGVPGGIHPGQIIDDYPDQFIDEEGRIMFYSQKLAHCQLFRHVRYVKMADNRQVNTENSSLGGSSSRSEDSSLGELSLRDRSLLQHQGSAPASGGFLNSFPIDGAYARVSRGVDSSSACQTPAAADSYVSTFPASANDAARAFASMQELDNTVLLCEPGQRPGLRGRPSVDRPAATNEQLRSEMLSLKRRKAELRYREAESEFAKAQLEEKNWQLILANRRAQRQIPEHQRWRLWERASVSRATDPGRYERPATQVQAAPIAADSAGAANREAWKQQREISPSDPYGRVPTDELRKLRRPRQNNTSMTTSQDSIRDRPNRVPEDRPSSRSTPIRYAGESPGREPSPDQEPGPSRRPLQGSQSVVNTAGDMSDQLNRSVRESSMRTAPRFSERSSAAMSAEDDEPVRPWRTISYASRRKAKHRRQYWS
ncbi:uncharacterized protein AB675_631 [Cyphellophora attinorum]|uniref:Uncharacterized protein n=1 Tax=Cyphellophora attinorum TaxID=1664694 RepID=A0A0N1P1V3_9EURO|nr:uncharacterized protein AB675_631 [Phialophora attinorum]KPI45807.1 hypothetical protein AB675_631 [Phialophora attinorum]